MKVIKTAIPGVLIFEPKVFGDDRGWFMESFNQKVFDEAVGEHVSFVQDNHTLSKKGVLRGLHFQRPPHAQAKLVRVVSGSVWDVAVDIRKSSSTFGKWVGVELSAENKRQFWIPPGFAHGFLALSDTAEFLYKTNSFYHAPSEGSIVWNDPQLAIEWPERSPVLAAKDAAALLLEKAEVFE
jgi:dTDP-4-dehydrorhamnose 3,5-epimerase